VVAHLRNAILAVRGDHPRLHTLAIGDLSAQTGGSITEHRSHQSGRDVDVGFFYKRKPAVYPAEFARATAANLNRAATWDLLVAFARTADDNDGVQAIFLDYDVQGLLFDWALDRGVDEGYLDRLFQYPDGKHGGSGLVRHEPHHDDHFHVRFKCPPRDQTCQ
jgi:murein endopeptidase